MGLLKTFKSFFFIERCDALSYLCVGMIFHFNVPLRAERSPTDVSFGPDNSEEQKRRGGSAD